MSSFVPYNGTPLTLQSLSNSIVALSGTLITELNILIADVAMSIATLQVQDGLLSSSILTLSSSVNSSLSGKVSKTGDTMTGHLTMSSANIFLSGTTSSITSQGGFTGSLTLLSNGNPYLVAGNEMSLVTSSTGSIRISASPSLARTFLFMGG